jgi:hypothetical protein
MHSFFSLFILWETPAALVQVFDNIPLNKTCIHTYTCKSIKILGGFKTDNPLTHNKVFSRTWLVIVTRNNTSSILKFSTSTLVQRDVIYGLNFIWLLYLHVMSHEVM